MLPELRRLRHAIETAYRDADAATMLMMDLITPLALRAKAGAAQDAGGAFKDALAELLSEVKRMEQAGGRS